MNANIKDFPRAILAVLIAIAAAAALSCNPVDTNAGDSDKQIAGLDDVAAPKVEKQIPGMDISPTSSGEEIWRSRCGTCHAPDYRIDKYKGEDWEYVINRMIKMEGAMFTPQLAEKVYEYLYNRTKRPDDPPFEEVIKGRSHFEREGDDGEEIITPAPAPAHDR